MAQAGQGRRTVCAVNLIKSKPQSLETELMAGRNPTMPSCFTACCVFPPRVLEGATSLNSKSMHTGCANITSTSKHVSDRHSIVLSQLRLM
jgi:hypothetical protein